MFVYGAIPGYADGIDPGPGGKIQDLGTRFDPGTKGCMWYTTKENLTPNSITSQ